MLSANLSSEGDNDTDGGKGEGRGKSGPGYEEIKTRVENSRSRTLRSGIVLHCLEVSHSCKCFFDNLFYQNNPSESFIDIIDNDDHVVHQLSVVTLKSAATTELGWVQLAGQFQTNLHRSNPIYCVTSSLSSPSSSLSSSPSYVSSP